MRRVPTIVSSGLLVLLLTTALPAATALAGSAGWAWAVARHPSTASYHPAAVDRGAEYIAGDVTIKRPGMGHYKVSFPGMSSVGGLPLVTPLGATPRVCNVTNWFVKNIREVIEVRCWTYAGHAADAKFVVYFIRGQDNLGPLAYGWNYSPSADVTLSGSYTFNSPGDSNSVDHRSTGTYRITLGGLGGQNGNVEVVAYGTTPGVCRVEGWGTDTPDQSIDMDCRDLGGQLQDMRFTFVYVNHVGLYGYPPADQTAGYVWADQPSSASYLPDARWNWSSDSPANRVTRSATGRYTVRMNAIAGTGGGAIVTAFGTGKVRCQLGSLATSGAIDKIGVRCFKPNGAPVDSEFNFAFTR